MKKRVSIALYAVAALTMFIPYTAISESGWVTWTKTEYIKKDLSNNIFWENMNAYPKYEQCLELKKRLWQVYKKQAIEDKNNNLWVASATDGLNRYNRVSDNFTRYVKKENDASSKHMATDLQNWQKSQKKGGSVK